MKISLFIIGLLTMLSLRGNAQFVNQGQLFISPGSQLVTKDDFTNTGTVTNNGVMSFSANLTNNSTFDATQGEGQLTGSATQTVGGTTGFTLRTLTLNNTAAGQSMVLHIPLSVTQTVNFTDGILATDATNLLTLFDNAQAVGAGNGSHVVGPVRKIGDDNFRFPLGNGTTYRPASIAPQGTTSDAYTAQYVESAPTNSANLSACLSAISSSEYWQIDHTTGSGSATVGLAYQNVATSSSITASPLLRVARYTGTEWAPISCSANGGTALGLVATDGNTADFGAFTLGAQNAGPTISGLSASNDPVCEGSSVTFTATIGNVTGSYNYTLSNGTSTTIGSSSNISFSQVLTASGSGAQTFTLTVTNSGPAATATTEITVNALPIATLTSNFGGTLTCAQTSLTLTASGSNDYVFSGPGILSQDSEEGIAVVNTAGVYSVTVTNTETGCFSTTTTTVTSSTDAPSVSISPSSATLTCASPSVSLTAVGTGTVLWSTGSTASVITVNTADTYSVTLTSGNGCIGTASVTIDSRTNETISFTGQPASTSSVLVGATVSTGVSVSGITTGYQWYKDNLGNAVDGQNTATLTLTNVQTTDAGSYFAVVTGDCNSLTSNAFSLSVTTPPFAITAVTTVTCTPITPNRFSVSFTPRYSGLTGQPISFSVVNELLSTFEPGPYTVQLYTDNSTIVLKATQTGTPGEVSFSYNWLAACQTSEAPNTPPTLVTPIPSLTAMVGTFMTYVIPDGTFTDAETPLSLHLSASGLPPGLSFSGATLSGTPSTTVGSPFSVSITATDPGNLSVNTTFSLSVLPASTPIEPTGPFAITGVTTITCTPISNRINISFAPRYAGMTGQPIAFEVVNELSPTTDPAPYSLTLYRDNPIITLKATQTGSPEQASFSYNWLEACASMGTDNTAPRVNSPVANQTAMVGQGISLNLSSTFLDQETPSSLVLTASGLPDGLALIGSNITGAPSMSGTSTITVTATDPGNLSVATSFMLVVSPAVSQTVSPPSDVFSITGVQTVSCEVLSAGERQLSFTPQYSGVNGQPISFAVVNEMAPTIASGPYTLNLYTDNPTITLKATQTGTAGEASFSYNWLAVCNPGGRQGLSESTSGLQVRVLGNPVEGRQAEVEVSGVAGQSFQLTLVDQQGRVLHQQRISEAGSNEKVRVPIETGKGLLLLQVSTATERQQIKLIKQ